MTSLQTVCILLSILDNTYWEWCSKLTVMFIYAWVHTHTYVNYINNSEAVTFIILLRQGKKLKTKEVTEQSGAPEIITYFSLLSDATCPVGKTETTVHMLTRELKSKLFTKCRKVWKSQKKMEVSWRDRRLKSKIQRTETLSWHPQVHAPTLQRCWHHHC